MATATKAWADSPLYCFLVDILPSYTNADGDRLVVAALALSMGYTTQAIYLWFKSGVVVPKTARKLCELASSADNLTALGRLGRQPPQLLDFGPFVLAD